MAQSQFVDCVCVYKTVVTFSQDKARLGVQPTVELVMNNVKKFLVPVTFTYLHLWYLADTFMVLSRATNILYN